MRRKRYQRSWGFLTLVRPDADSPKRGATRRLLKAISCSRVLRHPGIYTAIPVLLSIGILTLGKVYRSVTWRETPDGTVAVIECFLFALFAIVSLLWARAVQRERLRFEMLLAELSADFTAARSYQVEEKIQKWLQALVVFFGVDRSAFLQLSADGKTFHRSFFAATPGTEPMPEQLHKDALPWFIATMERGEIINLPDVAEGLPAEAVGEHEYKHQAGLKSFVAVPVVLPCPATCAVTLATLNAHRKWPASLIMRLRVVVEVFANALERMRAAEEEVRLNALVAGERRRLAEIISSVPGIVWESWIEPDRTRAQAGFVSAQVETLLGYQRDEWLSQPNFWLTVVHPGDRARAALENAEIIASCKGGVQQFRWTAKDGRTLWVEAHISVICDGNEKPVGMHGLALDITRRREAEQAWMESERLKQSIVDTMPSMLYLYDLIEQRSVFVNGQIVSLLGYTEGELRRTGRDFLSDLMHPDDLVHTAEQYRLFDDMDSSSIIRREYRMRHRNGEWRWLAGYQTVFSKTDDGRAKLVLGIAEDITERRLSEAALRKSEELNRTVIDSLPSMIVITDGEGRIVASNHLWGSWRGKSNTPVLGIENGSNYLDACRKASLAGDTSAAEALRGIESVLAHETTQFRLEYECAEDDEVLWFEMLVSALRWEEGGAVIAHTDITGRKKAQEELQKSNAQIHELAGRLITAQEEERSRIARELHDDLSQRLAIHTIELSKIRRDFGSMDEQLEQRLRDLQERAVDLGDVTRLISHELHSPLVEHVGLITALQSICREFARVEDILVEAELPEEVGQLAPEVAICLYRVTQESLHNIARHAKATMVEIALRLVPAGVILTIKDNGIGFDTTQPTLDHGLGLLSLRERVHLLHGTFSVTSSIGAGTYVTVQLPLESPL